MAAVKVVPTCKFLLTGAPSPISSNDERNTVQISKKSSITCKYWINGNCMQGDQCRYVHSFVKDENSRPSKRLIWWTTPPMNFVKINCDGAVTVGGNKASVGGVARDWKGRFIFGFSSPMTICSVVEAELRAIKIGIKAALNRGYTNLIVESDSYSAIDLIQQSKPYQHHALVSEITDIATKASHVSWNHVFREVNSVADAFAKHGLSLSRAGVEIFLVPPHFSVVPLCMDHSGKIYCR